MRDFFKSEFKTLKLKTGLNQYENLCALEDAENQIKLLLDMLVRVCDDFAYIPDNDKKRIIQEGIYRDTEFTQLVPRVVWKWLNAQSAKYFKEAAHIKPEKEAPPVAYDDLNPKLKSEVDDFIKSLLEPSKFNVPAITQHDLDVIKALDELSKGESTTESAKHLTTPEQAKEKALKLEWARLHTDLYTGKVKDGSPSFSEWQSKQ